MKHISFVKAFLRWANKNNYYENDLGFTFKPKLKNVQKKVIFLTIEEQKILKNLIVHIFFIKAQCLKMKLKLQN